jgi:hypothetical protein
MKMKRKLWDSRLAAYCLCRVTSTGRTNVVLQNACRQNNAYESLHTYCKYFLTYDWPWLYYLTNLIGSRLAHHCWSLNTEQQRNPSHHQGTFLENWHFGFWPHARCHSSDDITHAELFREMVSIYRNLTKTLWAVFEKMGILCFGTHVKDPYFLELECSYSSGMGLRWINPWISTKDKIRSTVQELAGRMSIQTAYQNPIIRIHAREGAYVNQ